MSEYKCHTSWFSVKGTAGTVGRLGRCRRQWRPGSAWGPRTRTARRTRGVRRARATCAAFATPAACHPRHAPPAGPATAAAASQSPTCEFTRISVNQTRSRRSIMFLPGL